MCLKNSQIIAIILLSFSSLFAQTQIAVVDFKSRGVSNQDVAALTDRLMIELFRTEKFVVLEREMLDKIMDEWKLGLSGCTADECLVEIGQLANVQQMVGGSISKVGEVYSVSARLISVETGELIKTGTYDHQGKIGELMLTGMANIAAQLASIPAPVQPEVKSNNISNRNTPRATSSGTVTDIDGNVYGTVQIGNQVWMAENLKVTHYRNGEVIRHLTDKGAWNTTNAGAYCAFDNNENNVNTYGWLYNWYSVSDSRGLAPEGWHVPTDEEWKELEIALGMSQNEADANGEERGTNEGSKLAGNADLWNSEALESDSEFGSSGFTALPGGSRLDILGGGFSILGNGALLGSATDYRNGVRGRQLHFQFSESIRTDFGKRCGFSIRCVKD